MPSRQWEPALFTDRAAAIHTFSSYLNDDHPRRTILFYKGDAGTGKSVLLRHLRDQCCKHLRSPDWQSIHAMPDDQFKEAFRQATSVDVVPCVLLDLGSSPQGIDRPQEALSALMMLRRKLAGHGFHFPLFDAAAVRFLIARQHTNAEIKAYFPSNAHPFIDQAINLLSAAGSVFIPPATLVAPLWNALKYNLGPWLDRYQARQHLGSSELEQILALDPDSELIDELPVFFARDLNAGMNLDSVPRLVLLFDAHETFWGADRDLSPSMYFKRDSWLRRLLIALDRSNGIVAVVAGQEIPRWPDATRDALSRQMLEISPIEPLQDADAALYLDHLGIQDAATK